MQQVLQGERVECRGQEAGRAADVYACGVHLYKMLFQRYPFEGTDAASMSLNIMSGNIVKPSFLVHPDIDSLLTRMLDANWQTRISVEEIMGHPAYLENLPSEVAVRPLNFTTRLWLCGGAARCMGMRRCGWLGIDVSVAQAVQDGCGALPRFGGCMQSPEEIGIILKATLPSAQAQAAPAPARLGTAQPETGSQRTMEEAMSC